MYWVCHIRAMSPYNHKRGRMWPQPPKLQFKHPYVLCGYTMHHLLSGGGAHGKAAFSNSCSQKVDLQDSLSRMMLGPAVQGVV